MLRASLSILIFLTACSVGPSTDIVIYVPVIELSDDGVRTRELLVTGTLSVLAVESTFDGSVGVRVGTVGKADWEALRSHLAGARHLRRDTARKRIDTPTFQIIARLGDEDIGLTREPGTGIEKDVAAAKDRLEAIWAATPEPTDPVAGVEQFLGSIQPRIRGFAARVLLKLWNKESVAPEVKAAAERALRAHLTVEEDRDIRHGIRDVIDQPKAE
jgi:hypothetical protein